MSDEEVLAMLREYNAARRCILGSETAPIISSGAQRKRGSRDLLKAWLDEHRKLGGNSNFHVLPTMTKRGAVPTYKVMGIPHLHRAGPSTPIPTILIKRPAVCWQDCAGLSKTEGGTMHEQDELKRPERPPPEAGEVAMWQWMAANFRKVRRGSFTICLQL